MEKLVTHNTNNTIVLLLIVWTLLGGKIVDSSNDNLDPAPGRSPGPPTLHPTAVQHEQQVAETKACTVKDYIHENLVTNDALDKSSSIVFDVIHDVFDTTNEPLVAELMYKGKLDRILYTYTDTNTCIPFIDFYTSLLFGGFTLSCLVQIKAQRDGQ